MIFHSTSASGCLQQKQADAARQRRIDSDAQSVSASTTVGEGGYNRGERKRCGSGGAGTYTLRSFFQIPFFIFGVNLIIGLHWQAVSCAGGTVLTSTGMNGQWQILHGIGPKATAPPPPFPFFPFLDPFFFPFFFPIFLAYLFCGYGFSGG